MDLVLCLLLLMLSSLLIFAVPVRLKYALTFILLLSTIIISSFWAIQAFQSDFMIHLSIQWPLKFGYPILIIDKLSAFFILVINFTLLTGFLYSNGYLKSYKGQKPKIQFSLHYFAFLWLGFSMILVSIIRDSMSFLVAWELMTVSSFILVIFDSDDRNVLKAGINYLIQMHIGFLMLMTAFLIPETIYGTSSFDGIAIYFTRHDNLPLFLLFFIGFGIKAGFVPLHTWLPQAHPAAPSHVSGIMSGVMIKMGIFGILRIMGFLKEDFLVIGIIVLVVSIISGLYGVMMAIVQHDLKRLLAYHSIENIGIIGIGIGIGMIGLSTNNQALAFLGFSGGLLHILNHSLFKSLLFYNAGGVYKATHTRNLEKLGGLVKKMPTSALLFLIGALAICGLPPFNGFISEYLIYSGLFSSLAHGGIYESIILLLSIIGLTLIGGLAIFCFTKAFSIVYLGQARSQSTEKAMESSTMMLLPQIMIAVVILFIGLGSVFFIGSIASISSDLFNIHWAVTTETPVILNLGKISLIGGVFVLLSVGIILLRRLAMHRRTVDQGPTWGCGYTAGSHKQQYTATSFADNYSSLAKPIIGGKKDMIAIEETEFFPLARKFESHNEDSIQKNGIEKPVSRMMDWLKKLAIMQTGQIQHYILYAFVFMILIFLLTYFQLI